MQFQNINYCWVGRINRDVSDGEKGKRQDLVENKSGEGEEAESKNA